MEMQKQMEAIKQRLDASFVEATSPENRVMVRMNGNRRVQQVQLDSQWLKEADSEEVSELIQIAVNRALEKADQLNEAEMRSVAGSMLPGMFS